MQENLRVFEKRGRRFQNELRILIQLGKKERNLTPKLLKWDADLGVIHLEYVEYNLRYLMERREECKFMVNYSSIPKCITGLMVGLRECGIIHLDLKPENILFNPKRQTFMLCDFEFSMLDGDDSRKPELSTSQITPIERFYDQNLVGYFTDMWALGCILFELITRVHIFKEGVRVDLEEIESAFGVYLSGKGVPIITEATGLGLLDSRWSAIFERIFCHFHDIRMDVVVLHQMLHERENIM